MLLKRLLRGVGIATLFLFLSSSAFAQKTVTGKVTDSKDGSALAGVSITAKGTSTGTTSKADGTFSIAVPENVNTLVVSSVGYATQEIAIGAQTSIDILLVATGANLNEVVVIGYGTARKRDLTGAVSTVPAKNFNQGITTSPDQLLQNKVPGLEITNNSGQPGAATTVKIRGNNSIRASNNPLYVIDGVPLDGRSARPSVTTGTFGVTPDLNPLIYINPNDIASIDVLKDASSAAIYGSRGANGVIVITTKSGTSGPTKVELGASFGTFAGYMKKFEVLDAGQFRSALKKYGANANLDGGQSVDALDEIAQHKLSSNYSIAFSGGNDVGRFRASFFGGRTQGLVKRSYLDRYLASFAGGYKFLDRKLSIDFHFTGGHVNEAIANISNNPGSQGNLISSALSWNPTMAFKDASGHYAFPANGSGNPLALIYGTDDNSGTNTFLANISPSFKILSNLEYKFLYAINHSTGQRNTNLYGWLQGYTGLSGSGYGAKSYAALTSQTFTHTLNYRAKLTDKLNLDAVGGFEYWKTNFSNSTYSASGFNTNLSQTNIIDIPYTNILRDGNIQNLPTTNVNPTSELQSLFARAILNYGGKYLLTATFRRDGSSKFGENNKYGNFPSVAAKWNIGEEGFLKGSSLFSNLSLRASWGITGNQEFPEGASQEQFSFSAYNTASQINVANPDLKWEQTTSYNFGVDFGLMKGRIYGSFDYYHKTTTDILFQSTAIQPAPASIYFINLPANLINRGVELLVGASIIDKTDLGWDLSFNIANNKNELQDFYAPGTKVPLAILTGQINGQGVSGTLSQIITNGYPVNEFYLKSFNGFDASGNQKIGDNPTYSGDPNPHTIYGVSTTLRYKKFTLTVNAGGAGGYLVYNNTATSITNIAGIANGRNIDKAAYDSPEKPTSPVAASARFLEKGDYFKIRNAAINYHIGNVGRYIRDLNAFVNGTNLLVITKFTGFDPEVNVDKSNNNYPSRSIEYIPYPTPRIISFGFNLSL
jgi:TonB-dependent starch-binding outer membrane protein SusC